MTDIVMRAVTRASAMVALAAGCAILARCTTGEQERSGAEPTATARNHLNATDACPTGLAAFPEAEGYGACTTGARNASADVYYVTNLSGGSPGSAPSGSLQYGIDNAPSAGRYILFKVSGVIDSPVKITKPNLYIAGQTSPRGVTVRGIYTTPDNCSPSCDFRDATTNCLANCPHHTSNLILRHIRSRPAQTTLFDGTDGLRLEDLQNAMIDHVSIGNAQDEAVQISRAGNVTLQNVLLAETMVNGHYIEHGGMLLNYTNVASPLDRISVLRNNFNRIAGRLPEMGRENVGLTNSVMNVEVSNNLYWDPQYYLTYGRNTCGYLAEDDPEMGCNPLYYNFNFVGNLFYTRPASEPTGNIRNNTTFPYGMVTGANLWQGTVTTTNCPADTGLRTKLFFQNNRVSAHPTLVDYDLATCDCNDFYLYASSGVTPDAHQCAARLDFGYGTPFGAYINPGDQSGQDALIDYMVGNVGAFNRDRDPMDVRLMSYVASRAFDSTPRDNWPSNMDGTADTSGAGIHTDALATNCTDASGSLAPADTDGDGMPDSWESANGTNPSSADANTVASGQEYPNLERYLNDRALQIQAVGYIPPSCGVPSLTNGNFENGAAAMSGTDSVVPTGWSAYGVGSSVHQVLVNSAAANQRSGAGTSAQLICKSRYTSGGQLALQQTVTGLTPGDVYTARTFYRIPTPAATGATDVNYRPVTELTVYDTSGNVIARSGFNGPTQQSNSINPWHEQKVTFTVPSGVTSVAVRNYVDCPPSGALGWTGSDLSVFVDDWSFTAESSTKYLHDPGFESQSFDGSATTDGKWFVSGSYAPWGPIVHSSTAARNGRAGVYMAIDDGGATHGNGTFAIDQRVTIPTAGTYAFSSNVLTYHATGGVLPARLVVYNQGYTATLADSGTITTNGVWNAATVLFTTTSANQVVNFRLQMDVLSGSTYTGSAVHFDNASLTPASSNHMPDGDMEDNDLSTFYNLGANPVQAYGHYIYKSANGGSSQAARNGGHGLVLHCGQITTGHVIESRTRFTVNATGSYRVGFFVRAAASNAPLVQLAIDESGTAVTPSSGSTSGNPTAWTELYGNYSLTAGHTYNIRAAAQCNGSASLVDLFVDDWSVTGP